MAKASKPPKGSWLLAEELLDAGDPAFVDELCRISDADKLGNFAKTWYADSRPASRRLMIEYLQRPFASYRHEALVKRLFKLVDNAGDDELMAYFTVGFDRSIRRKKATRHHYDWANNESWSEEYIKTPQDTELSRHWNPFRFTDPETGEIIAAPTREKHDLLRLYALRTRHYLRRRCWRYYRTIGKTDPARYVKAVSKALVLYDETDVADGLALLDNWTLTHVLFHDSEVLESKSGGWRLATDKSLADLKSAPMYADAWTSDPAPLLELLSECKCRPVRQWVISLIRQHFPDSLSTIQIKILLKWVASDDSELAELAIETLGQADTSHVRVADWMRLVEVANPDVLDKICELISKRLTAASLELEDIVKLCCARPIPVAELGRSWLGTKPLNTFDDCQTLLQVLEAEADSVRPKLADEAIALLKNSSFSEPGWVQEFLDCRHLDVRERGWNWLLEEEAISGHIETWQRLLENPYDDVHLKLTELLEPYAVKHADDKRLIRFARLKGELDFSLVRMLWASVIMNIHRGGRQKPRVVSAVVDRVLAKPEEAEELLPLLAVALRSVRSVEFRAGLTGIVELAEQQPALVPSIDQHFPELSLL